ncbi:MAG: hypothetical protein ACJ763_10695 [Bdellovibrionia bacterium]
MSLKKKLQNRLKNQLKSQLKNKKKKSSKGSSKLNSSKLNVFASVEYLGSESPRSAASDLDYPNSPPWIHFT